MAKINSPTTRCVGAAGRQLHAVPCIDHQSMIRRGALHARVSQRAMDSPLSTSPLSTTLESSVDEAVQSSSREALSSLGIASTAPEQLFDQVHVEKWTPLLLAYAPFGCVLAVVRMAAWVGGIALDASWFRNPAVVDAYMALLGVTVNWLGEDNIPTQRHVLVSNHVTAGDLLMLFQRPQRYVHLITSSLPDKVYACQNLPAFLQPANKQTYQTLAEPQQQQQTKQLNTGAVLQHQQHQQQHSHLLGGGGADPLQPSSSGVSGEGSSSPVLQVQQDQPQQQHQLHLQQQHSSSQQAHLGDSSSSSQQFGLPQHVNVDHLEPQQQQQRLTSNPGHSQIEQQQQQQPSVHLFPEGGMTNGKGMMRFSRGFMLFADTLPVVPVALRVSVAFPEISSHTIDSNFLANLFWCSFQPWTVMEARALPAMQLALGESKAAFVQRVQLAIAEELRVWIADVNIQQKRQLAGRQQRQQ